MRVIEVAGERLSLSMRHLGDGQNLSVSTNRGVSPQIIHFNRVFHYFHLPFWGKTPYFWFNTHVGQNLTKMRSLKISDRLA